VNVWREERGEVKSGEELESRGRDGGPFEMSTKAPGYMAMMKTANPLTVLPSLREWVRKKKRKQRSGEDKIT